MTRYLRAGIASFSFVSVWSFIYLVILGHATAYADQLVIYNIPSPHPVNWFNPDTVLRSVLRNHRSGQNHEIGHEYVGLYCTPRGRRAEATVLTGMTSATDPSSQLILDEGYGFGVLFYNFEGRYNSQNEALIDIYNGTQNGRLSYLTFDISSTTCNRLVTYTQEFHRRGYDLHYGLPNRPLYGEGSGCSAFASSFLEVAGIDREEFDHYWKRNILVPEEIVGGPMTGRFVTVANLIAHPFRRWAEANETHFPIDFWDPDLMHAYTRGVFDGSISSQWTVQREMLGDAEGLVFNVSKFPTPTHPIFHKDLQARPSKNPR